MSYHGNYSFADSTVVRVFCFGNFRHVSRGLTMLIDIFSFFFHGKYYNSTVLVGIMVEIQRIRRSSSSIFPSVLFLYSRTGLSSKRFSTLFPFLENGCFNVIIIHEFVHVYYFVGS